MPQKPPKKMTEQRLRNVAEAYVRRYGGSTARLRAVLLRRAERSLRFHGELERKAEVAEWIEALIIERVRTGASDDSREARVQAIRLSLAGKPKQVIASRLREKGFGAEEIASATGALAMAGAEVDSDWIACCRYARRRGLGPFRSQSAKVRSRESQLAALMRAGFRYGLAARLMDSTDVTELLAVLDDAPVLTLGK